jgi:hypothetical protein
MLRNGPRFSGCWPRCARGLIRPIVCPSSFKISYRGRSFLVLTPQPVTAFGPEFRGFIALLPRLSPTAVVWHLQPAVRPKSRDCTHTEVTGGHRE